MTKASNLAKKLLNKYHDTLPFLSAREIAKQSDIKVRFVDLSQDSEPANRIAGFTVFEYEKAPEIWCNADNEISERNFTIAHELAHCLMHSPSDSELEKAEDRQLYTQILYNKDLFPCCQIQDEIENEANEFAYSLLLQDQIFEKCFYLFEKNKLRKLSEIFAVPDHFIFKKIKDLNLL